MDDAERHPRPDPDADPERLDALDAAEAGPSPRDEAARRVTRPTGDARSATATERYYVVRVVAPGEKGGDPLHGVLERRVEVDERAQPVGQPLHAHRLLAPAVQQLLDAAVGRVHRSYAARTVMEGLVEDVGLLDLVHLRRPRRRGGHRAAATPA